MKPAKNDRALIFKAGKRYSYFTTMTARSTCGAAFGLTFVDGLDGVQVRVTFLTNCCLAYVANGPSGKSTACSGCHHPLVSLQRHGKALAKGYEQLATADNPFTWASTLRQIFEETVAKRFDRVAAVFLVAEIEHIVADFIQGRMWEETRETWHFPIPSASILEERSRR